MLPLCPKGSGFNDKGTFEIFTLIKNVSDGNFNEELTRDFVRELLETKINRKIYIGWQDIPRELERLKVDVELFAASDKYENLRIDEHSELMERIMNAIVQNYSLE